MSGKLRRYKKDMDYSYSFGVYSTIELLKHRPKACSRVLLRTNADRNSGVPIIEEMCAEHGVRIEIVDKAFERIGAPENCYAAGVFNLYEQTLAQDAAHVVLVGPRDMGNLGGIIRTMLAFGVANLGVVRPAAHVFDPKAVRASMGSVFQTNVEYFDEFEAYRSKYTRALYPFMVDGEKTLKEVAFASPATLIFGNESSGLDESFRGMGSTVRIPHTGTVDSLNLEIAVGIALYEFAATSS